MNMSHTIDLEKQQDYVIIHCMLIIFIFLCFSPGLNNFFGGDDFNWLFDTKKMLLSPSHITEHSNHSYFLRPTESLYFVINYLLAGFHPVFYQVGALLIHLGNVLLLSLLIGRISESRLAGLVGATFWGLNYKHTEAVFRPYGVADSLALLFCLGAFWLFLHRRMFWATCSLALGLLAKENAALFVLLITFYQLNFTKRESLKEAIKPSVPFWIATCLIAGLGLYIRATSSSYGEGYVAIHARGLSQFWENMLTAIGPDATFLRMVYWGGTPQLIPLWGSIGLTGILLFVIRKLPGMYQFGLIWMVLMNLPTIFVSHQTSRYYYIPLVGLSIIVGKGVHDMLRFFRQRRAQRAVIGVWLGGLSWLGYLMLGVFLEEQDHHYFSSLHQQAAESFQQMILPLMPRNDHTMAIFLKGDSKKWAEELYAQVILKPWYLPATYKWVFRRHKGVLGLANTYGFVTYCAHEEETDSLFVHVPYPEFREKMLAGDFYLVVHDDDTNTFSFGTPAQKSVLLKYLDDRRMYALLQPGRFDSTHTGGMYF